MIDLNTNEFECKGIVASKEVLSISGKAEEESTTLKGKLLEEEGKNERSLELSNLRIEKSCITAKSDASAELQGKRSNEISIKHSSIKASEEDPEKLTFQLDIAIICD